MSDGQWYTNKDLFELINELSDEMRETRSMIRQYNGLREKVDAVEKKVDVMEARAKGRSSVGKAIREGGGWFIDVISLIILFLYEEDIMKSFKMYNGTAYRTNVLFI